MKLRMLLIASMTLLLAPVGGLQAQQKPTICEMSVENMDWSPGFWRDGNSGTFTTNGETGTVTCNGPVNGKQPTGPGTFGVSGRYGTKDPDTCDNAEGIYRQEMTIPTGGGAEKWTDSGDWTAGVFQGGGAFGGEFSGQKGEKGTFEATPKQGGGDCVSQPMTKVRVTARWTIKG